MSGVIVSPPTSPKYGQWTIGHPAKYFLALQKPEPMNRRHALHTLAATTALPLTTNAAALTRTKKKSQFRFSLNTSTISGQKAGIEKYIDIAARAGYECIEVWIADVKAYTTNGGSLATLKKLLNDSGVSPVNAIGFATWMTDDDDQRKAGFAQMREEMEMMAAIGCPRIAAPAAGVKTRNPDLFKVGERYHELLQLGKQTGVMPQLEIWGSSVFSHLGQAMMAVAVADDPTGRILPDVYHLFRGNSGFESLKMLNGKVIEIFHMNDYPGDIPKDQMQDKDRIYPGDGIAPLQQLIANLKEIGGEQIFSLELFNRDYWKQDPLTVARTGLEKMKNVVAGKS
jgi:sugar phosphate isomerase/epimerase